MTLRSTLTALLGALLVCPPALSQNPSPPRAVQVMVRADRDDGALPPIWRFFGADEPNYATMKDGRKLLLELGGLRPGAVFFRTHNLLNTGDGTAAFKWGSTDIYREDAAGRAIYNWTVVDRIIDTYRARGIHPYLQIGFMPQAMSTAPAGMPYQHSWRPGLDYKLIATGWSYPPRDYDKWRELVRRWTLHNVERYGRAEVEQWWFEVWNEPNSDYYWQGSAAEFQKLHDYAVDGIRRALPTARVGGPDAAGPGGAFMDAFLQHVAGGRNYATGATGTPTDFLSFHAKGSPSFVDGHVRMGIANQLRDVQAGFAKIRAVPQVAGKPVVIGESDPEGCAACPGQQNDYRNGTMYASYTAASFARIWELARRDRVDIAGALSWSFEFEDQPWFAGYRQLATNGVDLPVLHVFRLFAKLGPRRLAATSDGEVPLERIVAEGVRDEADVGAIATRTAAGGIALLLWHYHDDDVPGPGATIRLRLTGLGGRAPERATLWRVDGDNANAFAAWRRMGSPPSVDGAQYAALEKASAMQPRAIPVAAAGGGTVSATIDLPRQGVALVELAPNTAPR